MADPKYADLPGIVSTLCVSCQNYVKIILLVNTTWYMNLCVALNDISYKSVFISTLFTIPTNIRVRANRRTIKWMCTRQLIYPNASSFKFTLRYNANLRIVSLVFIWR